jgi:hypothetical protein
MLVIPIDVNQLDIVMQSAFSYLWEECAEVYSGLPSNRRPPAAAARTLLVASLNW